MIRTALRLVAVGTAFTALMLGLAGCFNPFDPRIAAGVGIAEKKPEANSPEGVILLFQWCYKNRALAEYKQIFTSDYQFTFSNLDSAGAPYRGTPWRRDDELASAEHLFVTGTASEEAATDISLTFGNTLASQKDDRGLLNSKYKDSRYRLVVVGVVLDVRRPSSTLNVKGEANFYVVRGDIAQGYTDVTGFKADSLHWYIDGWVDGTVQNGVAQAGARPVTPASAAGAGRARPAATGDFAMTFGGLKTLYR